MSEGGNIPVLGLEADRDLVRGENRGEDMTGETVPAITAGEMEVDLVSADPIRTRSAHAQKIISWQQWT